MPRKKADTHYIYKTTCMITGRYYIGMHSTCNIDDGYLGSGKRLRHSIRKHGKENHVREILEYCASREQLIEREKEIVHAELIKDPMCINIREGGTGGFSSDEHRIKAITAAGKAYRLKLETDPEFKVLVLKRLIENTAKRNNNYQGNLFKGRKHSDETKKLMSKSSKGMGLGGKNSQYGTCWITNGKDNKKIRITDEIPKGWYKGRK